MNWTHAAGAVVALAGAYVWKRHKDSLPTSVEITSVTKENGDIVNMTGTDQRGKPLAVYLDAGRWYHQSNDTRVDPSQDEVLNGALRAFNRKQRDL